MLNLTMELIQTMRGSRTIIYQGLLLVLINHLGSLALNCLSMVPTPDLRILFFLLLLLSCICTMIGVAMVCVRLLGLILAPIDWEDEF